MRLEARTKNGKFIWEVKGKVADNLLSYLVKLEGSTITYMDLNGIGRTKCLVLSKDHIPIITLPNDMGVIELSLMDSPYVKILD